MNDPQARSDTGPAPAAGDVWEQIARLLGLRPTDPPKQPVGEVERLRYGMDIDGTITQAPRHFKRLIDALRAAGDCVYIVTARRESTRLETEALLASLAITYDELIMQPDDWLLSVADFKVQAVRQKELHLLMDDDPENCWAVVQRTNALAGLMLPIREVPQEEP